MHQASLVLQLKSSDFWPLRTKVSGSGSCASGGNAVGLICFHQRPLLCHSLKIWLCCISSKTTAVSCWRWSVGKGRFTALWSTASPWGGAAKCRGKMSVKGKGVVCCQQPAPAAPIPRRAAPRGHGKIVSSSS